MRAINLDNVEQNRRWKKKDSLEKIGLCAALNPRGRDDRYVKRSSEIPSDEIREKGVLS